jgi:hypothetical protein
MKQLIVKLDDSYCPRIDELIGELLGSEIVLDEVSPEYFQLFGPEDYKYKCPLLVIKITSCNRRFDSSVKILDISGSSDNCETPSIGIRNSLLKINNRYTNTGLHIHMDNPVYQLLESILCKYGFERSWKGFKSTISSTLTITYSPPLREDYCVILSRITSPYDEPDYYKTTIEKILTEMCDGSSELLQYSFKRMKSARKIEV